MKTIRIAVKAAELIPYECLIPFQGDLKSLSEENYQKLRTQIVDRGFSFAIHVWKDGSKRYVLDGHQRLRTVQQMIEKEGFASTSLPVNYVEASSFKEAKQKLLAAASQYGSVESDGLYQFISEAELEIDDTLAAISFPEIDLEDFKSEFFDDTPSSDSAKDVDEVIQPPVTPTTKRGDLYILGGHRLLCGDSCDEKDLTTLIDGSKIDMVYTDPPYGIDEPCDRNEKVKTFKNKGVAKKGSYTQIIGDNSTATAEKAFFWCDKISKTVIYWGGNYYAAALPSSACWIVWDKRVTENQSDLNSDCELAYVKHPHKKSVRIFRHLWKGMIKASEHGQKRVHPTQKPVALAEWCFENYGSPKTVLDLFGGSGSTLIAAEKQKAKAFVMELDPGYCDVIVKRWEDFTGQKAELIRMKLKKQAKKKKK